MDIGKVILFIAVFAAIAAYLLYNERKHKAAGTAIDRSFDFMECIETFTLRRVSDEEFVAAMKAGPVTDQSHTTMKGNASRIEFCGAFDAVLERLEQTDEKSVYQFKFTRWRTSDGTPSLAMNILLTSVEKAFLALDPNTQVTSKMGDYKTKVNFL